uniref:Uncharacterized protein n=1 Tax=Picea sitchensis TaxID=3332 RepID=A9NNT3_PICSI|nr:unknown [Picea sitchensis]
MSCSVLQTVCLILKSGQMGLQREAHTDLLAFTCSVQAMAQLVLTILTLF